MADHHHEGSFETGAEMDYPEHEKSYSMFVSITKWTTLHCIALLVAMAFGFFTSAGFVSSTVLFVLLLAVGAFFMR